LISEAVNIYFDHSIIDAKTRNRFDHILTGDDIHVYLMSSVSGDQNVILIRISWCKFGERLAVSKRAMQKLYIERFNLTKLSEVEG
jgi:hypothetical protein